MPPGKAFEHIVGKEENAGYHHFLLFSQCFLSYEDKFNVLSHIQFFCLQMLSNWTRQKLCRLVEVSVLKINYGLIKKHMYHPT